jgi:hypothetical protein
MVLDMGKIPYCGKENRKPYPERTYWTPDLLDLARRLDASGHTNDEIADAVGVTRGAVMQALARHRQGADA